MAKQKLLLWYKWHSYLNFLLIRSYMKKLIIVYINKYNNIVYNLYFIREKDFHFSISKLYIRRESNLYNPISKFCFLGEKYSSLAILFTFYTFADSLIIRLKQIVWPKLVNKIYSIVYIFWFCLQVKVTWYISMILIF